MGDLGQMLQILKEQRALAGEGIVPAHGGQIGELTDLTHIQPLFPQQRLEVGLHGLLIAQNAQVKAAVQHILQGADGAGLLVVHQHLALAVQLAEKAGKSIGDISRPGTQRLKRWRVASPSAMRRICSSSSRMIRAWDSSSSPAKVTVTPWASAERW